MGNEKRWCVYKCISDYKNVKKFDFNEIDFLQISIKQVYLKTGSIKL